MRLFVHAQGMAIRDAMPFVQAAPAAGACSVLRHEHRMTAKRRLLAIIFRKRRRQPARHQFTSMFQDHAQAFGAQISALTGREPEFSAEWRARQCFEDGVDLFHGMHQKIVQPPKEAAVDTAVGACKDFMVSCSCRKSDGG